MTAASQAIVTGTPSETMSINTPCGDMVRFTGENGLPVHRRNAFDAGLVVGQEYKVLSMSVGGTSSTVELAEGRFNTVLFENTGPVPDEMPDDGRMMYTIPGMQV